MLAIALTSHSDHNVIAYCCNGARLAVLGRDALMLASGQRMGSSLEPVVDNASGTVAQHVRWLPA